MAKIKPSIRSSTPPWPGMRLPESFRSKRRLTQDSNRSPIWQNKAYIARPALADTDVPFTKFRRWASQFYAEPVDDGADVYVPQDAYPFEPLETASRKYGSDPFQS